MKSVSYRVLDRIDIGGMAEIYKAIDTNTQDVFAIKRLLPELAQLPQYVQMFLDEAHISMELKHPNIVESLQLGKLNGSYFIAMEFIHGISLLKLLNFASAYDYEIPVQEALFIASQVARGLHYAHTKCDNNGHCLNIVHRDVSPPNILLSTLGEVKVIDFGLVKSNNKINKTIPGLIKGKFSYLSPEAAYGETIDHRSDIYSLGIILWEMLARKPLYNNPVEFKILEDIRKSFIPDLSQINPSVTPELFEIIKTALQRDKSKRYSNALIFANALEEYASKAQLPRSELNVIVSAVRGEDAIHPICIENQSHNIHSMHFSEEDSNDKCALSLQENISSTDIPLEFPTTDTDNSDITITCDSDIHLVSDSDNDTACDPSERVSELLHTPEPLSFDSELKTHTDPSREASKISHRRNHFFRVLFIILILGSLVVGLLKLQAVF